MPSQLQQSVELQHVNVKLLLNDPQGIELNRVVPVFHRWIQERTGGELLLDVADYSHVHHGPGVVLIGHEADYCLDNAGGRLGVRYNRKATLKGSNADRLKQAVRSAVEACHRLEDDPSLGERLHFNGHDLEIFINDRLLAPNVEDMRAAVESELCSLAGQLFGANGYTLTLDPDPRRLLTAHIHSNSNQLHTTAELLAIL